MSRWLRVLSCAVIAAAGGWLLLGQPWGAGPGFAAGVLCGRWWAAQPSPTELAATRRVANDLPFAVDLLAAAMRAGAAPDAAALLVAEAVGGPLGDRLARVGRALRLGATPDEAWAFLGSGDDVARVRRAAHRSAQTGAALADAFVRVADDLRTDRMAAVEAAARRAGVLIVLPLGLCFLPAFVLTGLVPVIVAVLGDLMAVSP